MSHRNYRRLKQVVFIFGGIQLMLTYILIQHKYSDIGDQDILDEAKAIHMKKNDNLASNSHKKTDLALSPANLRYYHKVNISSLSHWNYEHSSSMERLLQQMGSNWHFEWIKQRLKKMWPEFLEAGKALVGDCLKNKSDTTRKVMILPGVLTLTDFARPEKIRLGGPLGEMLQWADLIAGCYALCRDVAVRLHISSTTSELRAELEEQTATEPGCANSNNLDVIFTDIGGFRAISEDIAKAYKNNFRILDAYGTEAMYNDPEFAKSQGVERNHWTMLDLKLKQFYTLFPHTPDNSFLGFTMSKSKLSNSTVKEGYSLIMGKESRYLANKRNVLDTIHKYFPLKATLPLMAQRHLPLGAEALGIVDSAAYLEILRKAKVCVGLGDPIDSPSPLEALAMGCIYLNPKRKGDSQILRGKPTGRLVTSQNPYLEDFIGTPYVYTYDEDNLDELISILKSISASKDSVRPMIPLEFSVPGYLQRLQSYLVHQDFCHSFDSTLPQWPPLSALQTIVAPVMTSCKQACFLRGLVCEPDFFPFVNNVSIIARLQNASCKTVDEKRSLHPPSYLRESGTCFIQPQEDALYSCAGGESNTVNRICPCRDYIQHQVALCKQCI